MASPTDTGLIPIISGPQAPQEQRRVFSPGFGLRGPRRNRHVVTVDELAAVSMPIGDDGVIIGVHPRDVRGEVLVPRDGPACVERDPELVDQP
ncbi:hypothetical protein ACWDAZ_27685, partial [Streptomyces sp. NPDC001215]